MEHALQQVASGVILDLFIICFVIFIWPGAYIMRTIILWRSEWNRKLIGVKNIFCAGGVSTNFMQQLNFHQVFRKFYAKVKLSSSISTITVRNS